MNDTTAVLLKYMEGQGRVGLQTVQECKDWCLGQHYLYTYRNMPLIYLALLALVLDAFVPILAKVKVEDGVNVFQKYGPQIQTGLRTLAIALTTGFILYGRMLP